MVLKGIFTRPSKLVKSLSMPRVSLAIVSNCISHRFRYLNVLILAVVVGVQCFCEVRASFERWQI